MANVADDLFDDEVDYDKEEVKSAKDVVQHLTKTAKTLKIYLSNNPIHQKFINSLFEKFSAHLEDYGPLRLRIKQFELLCSGQAVYENLNRLESLAFRLFIDGLREVSFHPGLEKEEMISFLQILGKEGDADAAEDPDDDIVTLLWEKNFAHIQYILVDDLKGDMEEIEACKEMRREPPSPQQLQAVYNQEANISPAELRPKGVDIPSLHIFKLTEEEVSSVRRELRWEEGIDIVNELEGMLFDIIRIERDLKLFSEVLGVIDNILEQLMFRGDFAHARKILEFFWEMLDPSKGLESVYLEELKKALARAGDPERIVKLEPVLNGLSSEKLDDFLPFMVLFQKEVIPAAIELLAVVQTMKVRRVLCDTLEELGRDHLESLIEKVDDDRWYLVRNLIYIIGKIGGERAIETLPRFIHHPELKVRKEVLHVLDAMTHPRAPELLIGFISDPDLSNRVYAMKSLAKKQVKEGLRPLLELIDSKGFEEKALYEKKEIFNAVAKLGGDSVLPTMQQHLKTRWSLFRNIQAEERGLCAALALQRIASPGAIDVLQEGRASKNKTIREACIKALDLILPGAGK